MPLYDLCHYHHRRRRRRFSQELCNIAWSLAVAGDIGSFATRRGRMAVAIFEEAVRRGEAVFSNSELRQLHQLFWELRTSSSPSFAHVVVRLQVCIPPSPCSQESGVFVCGRGGGGAGQRGLEGGRKGNQTFRHV